MAAETYTTGEVDNMATQGFKVFPAGTVGIRETSWTGTFDEAGDVLKMLPIFRGERVLDVQVICTDLAVKVLTFSVGDSGAAASKLGAGNALIAGDDDRYIHDSTVIKTGGIARLGDDAAGKMDSEAQGLALHKTYAVPETLDLKVETYAAAGDEAKCTIVCRMTYVH